MSNAFTGEYATKRDGGILYSYEPDWQDTEQGFHWSAKIQRGDALVGTIGGDNYDLARIGVRNVVKMLVNKHIEVGTGIRDS